MPLSPRQAISRSPKAKLNDEETANLADMLRKTDAYMETEWNGGTIVLRPRCTSRTMSFYFCCYEEAGWTVGVQALDGKFGKAQELCNAGLVCEFMVTMSPRWSTPESMCDAVPAPPVPPAEGTNGVAGAKPTLAAVPEVDAAEAGTYAAMDAAMAKGDPDPAN